MYYNSRYNFCFETNDFFLLYNSKSGSTLKLIGNESAILGEYLTGSKKQIDPSFFKKIQFKDFIRRGYIVESNVDELLEIRERYWHARGETPVVLTITTTMNCNLGCYYCYEERTQKRLEFEDTDSIIQHLNKIFLNNRKSSLHVDWYGGEPLLNIEYMENASFKIQDFCKSRKINYHSSIISNGTLWPEDLKSFIDRHKIREVQISFDGLKENHNKRRRYRKEFQKAENNSFDLAFNLVDELLDLVTVDIRFNIDWKNKADAIEFLKLIINKGWFNKRYPAIFQPARLSSYSEKSSFMLKKQLTLDEFDEIWKEILKIMDGIGKVEESEVPDDFPYPKTSVCAALATNSFVVGADKLIYRCGLQVGEEKRAVGSLDNNTTHKYNDQNFWNDFDPTQAPACSKCSFLPVCFGGCPKKHLENDQTSLEEQSDYWKNNLAQKVTKYLGLELLNNQPLKKEHQFREGYH